MTASGESLQEETVPQEQSGSFPGDLSPLGDTTAYRILEAAARLFHANGFSATSTREIAATVGIQKATLYHHIRRKDDLLYEICATSLARLESAADVALSSSAEPGEQLASLIEAHVVAILGERHHHAVMLTELRALTPERRQRILKLRRAYEDRVGSAIERAQETNRIRANVSARDLRLALLNMMNWTIFWFDPEGALAPSEIGSLYADLFMNGAATDGQAESGHR